MLLAAFRQLLTSFPELQRSIEVQPTLFQGLYETDQFVPALFVPELTNVSSGIRFRHQCPLGSQQ